MQPIGTPGLDFSTWGWAGFTGRTARHPHIHLISIHANSLIHKCAWVTRYYDDVMPIDTHVRSPRWRINEAWSRKRDWWAQIAANSNVSLSAFYCIRRQLSSDVCLVMMMCIRRPCSGCRAHYFGSPVDAVKETSPPIAARSLSSRHWRKTINPTDQAGKRRLGLVILKPEGCWFSCSPRTDGWRVENRFSSCVRTCGWTELMFAAIINHENTKRHSAI